MATITLCLGRPTQQLPCPIEPNKISRDQDTRPANGRFALGRADLPPSRPCSPAKKHWPTPPNLHSLDSWSAVSCNEGFCNASERQRLPSATDMASQKPHRSANLACGIGCGHEDQNGAGIGGQRRVTGPGSFQSFMRAVARATDHSHFFHLKK